MNELKELREQAGLSLAAFANLFGISKSMMFKLEKGKCRLSTKQAFKYKAIYDHLQQNFAAGKKSKAGRVEITDTIKLAELHRKKMESHRKLAASCKKELEKMQQAMPVYEKQLALREYVKHVDIPGYVRTRGDELREEIIELQAKKPPVILTAELELLQDKIDTHLAYADLHEQRWGMYAEM